MNKIDTEYTSLDQVNPEIARFYEEETRERVVGHTEPDEEGYATPITEPYIVVVLNKPDAVTYEDVAQRRGERKSWEPTVKAELEMAILWEDFVINHDGYLEWEKASEDWKENQPTETIIDETGETTEVLIGIPELGTVDLSIRREHYELITTEIDTNLFTSDESTVEYDDTNLTAIDIPLLVDKPVEEVSAYHGELAINTRYDAVYAPLAVGDNFIDIGRGKDGVLGIDNVKDTIMGYDSGMEGAGSVMWIMTDNSVMELTIADLRQIIVDFNTRKQITFMAYGQWRETDRLSPFEVPQ